MKNVSERIKETHADIYKSQEFDLLYNNQSSKQITSTVIREIIKF